MIKKSRLRATISHSKSAVPAFISPERPFGLSGLVRKNSRQKFPGTLAICSSGMHSPCVPRSRLTDQVHTSYIFSMTQPVYSSATRHIYIIAGPNGAGKTTFARRFIPASANITQFVNADLIASGLSPFAPEREAVQAGKLMLRQIEKLVAQGESFSFETTLAGRSYARMIPKWQARGYIVHLLFLALPDAETAIARVAARVVQGGHAIPEEVIRRRFAAGLRNFHSVYKLLVNGWTEYDNSGQHPVQVATGENNVSSNDIIQL